MRAAPLIAAFLAAAGAAQAEIKSARYADPTTRYDHGVLGDAVEYGALVLRMTSGPDLRITLPSSRVFEDTTPRLADVDGDGTPEVIAVETDLQRGARLSIYDENGLVDATPYIGQTHRWLAPVGAADVDGDGLVEIAYVDRPHLARTLRVWRFRDGQLEEIASAPGHTNHRIGDREIFGGVRLCDGVVELVTASPDWSRLQATRLEGSRLVTRDIGANRSGAAARALDCR